MSSVDQTFPLAISFMYPAVMYLWRSWVEACGLRLFCKQTDRCFRRRWIFIYCWWWTLMRFVKKNCITVRTKGRQKIFLPFWWPVAMEALTSKDNAATRQKTGVTSWDFCGIYYSIYIQQQTHIPAWIMEHKGLSCNNKDSWTCFAVWSSTKSSRSNKSLHIK